MTNPPTWSRRWGEPGRQGRAEGQGQSLGKLVKCHCEVMSLWGDATGLPWARLLLEWTILD